MVYRSAFNIATIFLFSFLGNLHYRIKYDAKQYEMHKLYFYRIKCRQGFVYDRSNTFLLARDMRKLYF